MACSDDGDKATSTRRYNPSTLTAWPVQPSSGSSHRPRLLLGVTNGGIHMRLAHHQRATKEALADTSHQKKKLQLDDDEASRLYKEHSGNEARSSQAPENPETLARFLIWRLPRAGVQLCAWVIGQPGCRPRTRVEKGCRTGPAHWVLQRLSEAARKGETARPDLAWPNTMSHRTEARKEGERTLGRGTERGVGDWNEGHVPKARLFVLYSKHRSI